MIWNDLDVIKKMLLEFFTWHTFQKKQEWTEFLTCKILNIYNPLFSEVNLTIETWLLNEFLRLVLLLLIVKWNYWENLMSIQMLSDTFVWNKIDNLDTLLWNTAVLLFMIMLLENTQIHSNWIIWPFCDKQVKEWPIYIGN